MEPGEFFTWTLAQNFTPPQDVSEWRDKTIATQGKISSGLQAKVQQDDIKEGLKSCLLSPTQIGT